MGGPGRWDARARAARTALLSLALASVAGPSLDAAAAPRPRKSAQDCNDELRDRAAAIAAAGMSASAFFHSCWWSTEPGTPTPIVADERAKRPFEAKAFAAAAIGVGGIGAVTARPAAPHPARSRPMRNTARRPPSRRDEAIVERAPSSIDERIEERAEEAITSSAPPYPAPAAMPGRVTVGVPAIGQLSLPVLPALAPAVRAVVDHSPVPGLVTATP